jgi:threonine dehydrogenase-like Zn-dependent dehydrogenase
VAGYERLGGINTQKTVVVQGSGFIGLYSTVMATESGAGKVIVIGAPANHLELAKKWGADEVIDIEAVPDAFKEGWI